MRVKVTELQCREVICINDGRRLGYVSDVQIAVPEGQVLAVVVPGRFRLLGLGSRREDYIIPWKCVRRIGPDILLADVRPEECRVPRRRQGLLG